MLYEAEVLPGLLPFAAAELHEALGRRAEIIPTERDDQLIFHYDGQPEDLTGLKTIVAVYIIVHLPIPRPKALLGHQHFTAITREIHRIRSANPSGAFSTFRISAAGSDSRVFRRFRTALAEATHLTDTGEGEAELFIRVRPAMTQPEGWEVLLRTTPLPLGARDWRLHDMQGALHATIAAAVVRLSAPTPADRVCNLMCGSGTLLIERAANGPTALLTGLDVNPDALTIARENIAAAGLGHPAHLLHADAAAAPFPPASLDVLLVDLPWGHLVGTQEEIAELYPAALIEAARIARPGARFVVITHAVTLFEEVLARAAHLWALREQHMVYQGGLHPRIILLERLP